MKLKLDEHGNVVLQDGKPVYVHDDGKEIAFDAVQMTAKVNSLTAEKQQYLNRAEKAENSLKAFDGIDVEKAKSAIETVKNLDDKKLIDIGEVERVKAETKKVYDELLAKAYAERDAIQQQFHTAVISGEFARSSFIKDKTTLPPEIAQSFFAKHFNVNEQGQVVAKDTLGNPILSRTNAGEIASFDEAIELLVGTYPQKDTILKGSSASGAGAGQPGQGGNVNTPKSYADCKTDEEKVAWLEAQS
ncbi:DUF6651 domain-containing protein [Moraxella sp. ZY210820]|uniref:DUF6651 domain-containing protein n=1 Tax=Moraxella sp. ZY210820 TaxID=2904123 RepID=UPI0027308477|nr:DUF6651 domain-containing protein [Moraxella sp. ZY210820]WLF84831.1 hypothetical protein LU301_05040 [Moraxella sp. ZY210820]